MFTTEKNVKPCLEKWNDRFILLTYKLNIQPQRAMVEKNQIKKIEWLLYLLHSSYKTRLFTEAFADVH